MMAHAPVSAIDLNQSLRTNATSDWQHPNYVGFVLILFGLLLQWQTLLILLMFPVLVATYGRLAMTEALQMHERFDAEWNNYAMRTPRFFPRLGPLGRIPQ